MELKKKSRFLCYVFLLLFALIEFEKVFTDSRADERMKNEKCQKSIIYRCVTFLNNEKVLGVEGLQIMQITFFDVICDEILRLFMLNFVEKGQRR